MKVVVVGQGYVGLPIAIFAAKAGYEVIGFDLNSKLTDSLNQGISHIGDISDQDLVTSISNGSYRATSDPSEFADAEIAVIAVPTPLDEGRKPDLKFLRSAAEILGINLKKKSLIINESTSFPGTLRNLIAPVVSNLSKLDHLYAISPERVDPGNKDWTINNTPRLYAGLTSEASSRTREFYEKFSSNLVEVSSPEVAESAKLFENTFRQVNIALVNEFAQIANAIGISAREVLDAASTKPYGFMKFLPGIGVGGHCIPVDPAYLAYSAEEHGVVPRFINLANEVNLGAPSFVIQLIQKRNIEIKGKKVLVCGIAYKSNISDVRESPSLDLIVELRILGAEVTWYDPEVSQWNDEDTYLPNSDNFDICILAIRHDNMEIEKIVANSKYIFDCTGTIAGVDTL